MSAAVRRRACVGRSHCNTSSAFGHFCSGHMVWLDPPHKPLLALRDTAREQEGDGPWWGGACCREGQSGEIWEQRSASGLVCPRDCPGNQLPVTLPWGLCCSGYPSPWRAFTCTNTCSSHSPPQSPLKTMREKQTHLHPRPETQNKTKPRGKTGYLLLQPC